MQLIYLYIVYYKYTVTIYIYVYIYIVYASSYSTIKKEVLLLGPSSLFYILYEPKVPKKLKELFNCINILHSTITFSMVYSTTEMNFIGVTVTKAGNIFKNKLETDSYCKSTNTYQYLHEHS